MDPLIIVAVVVLVLTIVVAIVIFMPRGDFSPQRAEEVAAPLRDDGPIMMKYQGGALNEESQEPLQDVIQFRDDDDAGVPMPSKNKVQPTQSTAGLVSERPKPPAPAPGNGPIMRPFDPGMVLGGDGAAVPAPGEGQKDVLNFTKPPTQNRGSNGEE